MVLGECTGNSYGLLVSVQICCPLWRTLNQRFGGGVVMAEGD